MQASIISYAFSSMMQAGKVDIFGYLEAIKYRFGLTGADIWNGMLYPRPAPGSDPMEGFRRMLTSAPEEALALQVKDALGERGLELACFACDLCHIWEDDPERRALLNKNAWAHIALGEKMGAKTIRIDAGASRMSFGGPPLEMEFTNEQFDYIVAMFIKYAQRAYDNGYRIGPENHWGPEDVPAQMVKLCKAVNSPAFGVLMHIGRWRGDQAAQGDEMVAPWAMHTHVTPATPEAETATKMAMLRDAGYTGYYSAELVSDSYAELGVQIARIKAVLDRWRIEGK